MVGSVLCSRLLAFPPSLSQEARFKSFVNDTHLYDYVLDPQRKYARAEVASAYRLR